ncbi:MAG: hypothetical protein KJ893_09740 [Candidatus Omnitrophica bacterium]|nr:hypothetical protein [Candidatus Omnitrophota bacterium]MBU4479263.1 hypothetical protein [Candidatus Omnitrophota bacterium]MCG2703061.1 tetratricopeptide repeat protein [Candidatus Omnitrophota bacterium]
MKKNSAAVYFEIEFFEKLLKGKPGYVDVLIPLAEAYTKAGLYAKGLEMDERLVRFKPDDPLVHYNLACSYSLLGKVDMAFKTLEKAVSLGYDDFKFMDSDPDLSTVRQDQRYQNMISSIVNKKGEANGNNEPV